MKQRLFILLLAMVAVTMSVSISPRLNSLRHVTRVEAASGATAIAPLNADFEAGPVNTGAGPTNYDYSGGSTGWNKTGSGSISYAGGLATLSGGDVAITSSGYVIASGTRAVKVRYQVPAPGFSVSISVLQGLVIVGTMTTNDIHCNGCLVGDWVDRYITVDASAVGQSVTIRINKGNSGTFIIDEAGSQWMVAPAWNEDSDIQMHESDDGKFIEGGQIFSPPFTVTENRLEFDYAIPSDAPYSIYVQLKRLSDNSVLDQEIISCLSSCTAVGWTTRNWIFDDDWTGETVYLRFYDSAQQSFFLDNVGLNLLEAHAYQYFPSVDVQDPFDSATGVFTHTHTDILIPGKGLPLEFSRTYQSMGLGSSDLGSNWRHNYSTNLRIFNDGSVSVRYAEGGSAYFQNVSGSLTAPPGVFDTLVKNVDNSYTLTNKSQEAYAFDPTGRLVSITDRNGNATTITYDGSGQIQEVEAAGGQTLSFTVDGDGRITDVEDLLGRTVSFDYDAAGDLVEVTDVKGGVTTYTYSSHRMTSLVDSNNHSALQQIFDDASRVVEQTNATGGVSCAYYGSGPSYTSTNCPGVSPSPSAGQTILVDPLGNKATYDYDLLFRTTSVTDDTGAVTAFSYDSANNRTCITDPLSHKTAYTYDGTGNVTGIIDAENTDSNCALASGGVKWTYIYNSRNDVELEVDPLGHATDYVYDSIGNLRQVIRRDGTGATVQRTCFNRDEDGLVTELIESTTLSSCVGHRSLFGYDTYGNMTSVIDPRFANDAVQPLSAVKMGTFLKSASTGSQTITHDLGAEPKAILLWTGSATASDSTSFMSGQRVSIGMSDGTASHSKSAASQDNVNTSNTGHRHADAALSVVQWDGSLRAEALLTNWNENDFTLNWTTNDSTTYSVSYLILGGSDVSAKVLDWLSPSSTGNVSVTGAGFEPDLAINLYGRPSASTSPHNGPNAGIGLGVMDDAGNEWATFEYSRDGRGTSETARGIRTDRAIFYSYETSTWENRASYVSMDADGFTVNFDATETNQNTISSLVLKGIEFDLGNFTKSVSAAPASQSITGAGFEPAALLMAGVQTTSTGQSAGSRWALGAADDNTAAAFALQDANGSGFTSVDAIHKLGKTFVKVDNTTPAIDAEADLTSFDSDGFTLNWTTNDSDADVIGYLALGAQAAADNTPVDPPETTMTYDLGGRRLTVINELDHTTTFTYDNQNNVLTMEDELSNTTTNTYDPKGNLLTITDANTNVTTYDYDDADRLVSVTDGIGGVTTYGYDAVGNRTSVTNANREIVGTAEAGADCGAAGTGDGTDDDSDSAIDDGCPSMLYAYDTVNRLISQTDALGNDWDYGYDEAGRLDTRTDPKSQATAYAYNLRNQLAGIDYPVGTTDVTFDYDDVGNRTEMVDATGTTTYDYDALDRLSTVTFPGSRAVGYTYDAVGNRASITYPGGSDSVDYDYDEAGNLVSVTDWNSDETTYDYDDVGLLEHANLPNGVVGTYTYDNADRLTGIHWVKGANTLAFVDYTLDDVGNRTQRVDGLGTHTYAYDDLYRLTSVTYPGPDDLDYTYDAVGNRLTLVDANGTTDYAYDAADRLTSMDPPSASPVTYSWDDNGNLTARGSDSFAWDAEDRMTSATVSSVTTTFSYNGDGLRDSLTVNSNTTTFTWDVNTSISQVLDDEDFRYVYGLGRVAQVGTDANYYLADGLGSTMALTDDTGAVIDTYDYDVFGGERGSTGSQDNDFTFAGEQRDESTGLQYLRARYYDLEVGRFISRDSFPGVLHNPSSQNRFSYAHNAPTILTDASGHCISIFESLCGKNNPIAKEANKIFNAVKSILHPASKHGGTMDVNVSGCIVICFVYGRLEEADGDSYSYWGTGVGLSLPAVTITWSPFSVTQGTNCELAASYVFWAFQGGIALADAGFDYQGHPVRDHSDRFYGSTGPTFGWPGLPGGVSWTCIQVSYE
jgi:RHS repeat-associated protein